MYIQSITFILERYYGIDTAHQIHQSFSNALQEEYSCYFLGNSRIYRGIDPDSFTHVQAFNFAHDNDTYNQMYYKLLYLEKHHKPDYLIIGTDYFMFSFLNDSRNYIYTPFLGLAYQHDYISGSYNVFSVLEEFFSDTKYLWKDKRPSTSLLAICKKLLIDPPSVEDLPYQKENGQYIHPGNASPEDIVTRNYEILDIQWEYFLKIIDNCQENGIELYVIMPPTRDAELSSYTLEEINDFDAKIEEALNLKGHYLNCCNLEEFKSYTNYTDITHLNEDAASRFSTYLNEHLPFCV